MLTSGHDIVAICIYSQQLWLPEEDDINEMSSIGQGGAPKTPHFSGELLEVDGF